MINSTGFSYRDIHSDSKFVYKVQLAGGLIQESFLADKNVETVKLRDSNKSSIRSVMREPKVIPMALFFEENLTEENAREVKRWLETDNFHPLRFDSNPSKIYYAQLNGAVNLSHNAISSGYIELEMLTNSPYSFSDYTEISGESKSASAETRIVLNNDGDIPTAPEIEVIMSSSPTNIEIFNETTGQKTIIGNNLSNETITIYNEYEEIHTSSSLVHKYDAHNGVFIHLIPGDNVIKLKGVYRYKMKFQPIYF